MPEASQATLFPPLKLLAPGMTRSRSGKLTARSIGRATQLELTGAGIETQVFSPPACGLATHGGAVRFSAHTITVGSTGAIDTRANGRASGAITLNGLAISLAPGAVLRADAVGIGGTAADVTLSVQDATNRIVSAPIAFTSKQVSIGIDGATILGNNVTVRASATDQTIPSSTAALALGYVGQLADLLNKLPGGPLDIGAGGRQGNARGWEQRRGRGA